MFFFSRSRSRHLTLIRIRIRIHIQFFIVVAFCFATRYVSCLANQQQHSLSPLDSPKNERTRQIATEPAKFAIVETSRERGSGRRVGTKGVDSSIVNHMQFK